MQTVDINHGGDILQADAIYHGEQSSGVQRQRAVMVYTAHTQDVSHHNVSHIYPRVAADMQLYAVLPAYTEHFEAVRENAVKHVGLHAGHEVSATSCVNRRSGCV